MKFVELTIFNFGPYKGEHTIKFPSSSNSNIMVVFGDNMRGKTSLLNTLRWVLHGTAFDRQLNEMDLVKIVNFDAQRERECKVWVRLKFEAEGREYELSRHAEPKRLFPIPRNSNEFDVSVLLKIDGNHVPADSVEHHINQLIPNDISRFYLFDGELLQEYEMLLVEEESRGEEIKRAIEQVLGVPALIRGKNHIQTLQKSAMRMQLKECEHVKALEDQVKRSAQLQAELKKHEEDSDDLERQRKEKTSEIKEIDDELARTKEIAETQAKLALAEERVKQLKEKETELVENRQQVIASAWKDMLQPRLKSKIRELSVKIQQHEESQQKRLGLKQEIKALQKQMKEPKCNTCGHLIDDNKKISLAEKLGQLQSDLEMEEVSANDEAFSSLKDELARLLQIQPTDAYKKYSKLDSEYARTQISITELEGDIETYKEQIKGHDVIRIAQLGKQKEGLLKVQGVIEHKITEVTRDINSKRAEMEALSKIMNKNPEARKQRASKQVNIYNALEKVFTDSIDLLRERLKEKVESEASEVFYKLTTEKTYTGLKINKNYGLTILDRFGDAVSVRSAGAEQIVALALITSLNRTANRPAPIVMDTPFGRLDPKHRYNILKFLPEMAEQVILFVHQGEVNRETGLEPIQEHIGVIYEIDKISSSESKLTRSQEVCAV